MTPSFNMPDDLFRALRVAAARSGVSMSAFVCAAVRTSIVALAERDEPLRQMVAEAIQDQAPSEPVSV